MPKPEYAADRDYQVSISIRRWDHGDALDKLTMLATLNQQIQHLYGVTAGNLGWTIDHLDDRLMRLTVPGHAMEQLLATLPTVSLTALSGRRIILSVLEIKCN